MTVVVVYRTGPGWDPGQPVGGQPEIEGHVAYLATLEAQGLAERAGPFGPGPSTGPTTSVSLALFAGSDVEAVRELTTRDPAVGAGVLVAEAYAWLA